MSEQCGARWKRNGEFHVTVFWGPNPDDPVECGALLRKVGVVGTNVTEVEPEGMGRHLPRCGLKAAPFLEGQPGVFFLGEKYLKEVVPAFRADRANPERRVRVPCFNDPAVQQEVRDRVERRVRSYDPDGVLYFSVSNEPTVTESCSPFDFCSCPHCAAAFRRRLGDEYGGLEALNQAWGSAYIDWEQIEGMTTDRAKELFAADRDASLAEWFAFRRFMDFSLHRMLSELRDLIRQIAPGVPVALTGMWPPGVFGGQDWEWMAGRYDLLECYNEVGELELARSICDGKSDLMGTFPGRANESAHWNHAVWYGFIHGARSYLVDPFSSFIDRKTVSLTDGARRMQQTWIEPMTKLSPLLADFARLDDPVFVLHSHASLARKWVETELSLDEDWAGREWAYPRQHETYLLDANGWYRLIEDAGRQFRVVTGRVGLPKIEGGDKLLILPMAVALSDDEITWIRRFLDGGGTVLYDEPVGRFDEQLRPRSEAPLAHERLIHFEHDLIAYALERCETLDPLPALEAFEKIVDDVLPAPWVTIEPAEPGHFELTTFSRGVERILAVQRNDARISTGRPLPDIERASANVTVRFAEPAHVSDILTGEDYGGAGAVELTIDPIRPTFLNCGVS